MVLGVKESVSGKRFALDTEMPVCGGKGTVYLSGSKVALRCCGKTSIVATRKMKQSVLRQGDVLLLELRDMFYANGTLTKYEVIDMDAPAKVTLNVLPTRVPSIVMSSSSNHRTGTTYGNHHNTNSNSNASTGNIVSPIQQPSNSSQTTSTNGNMVSSYFLPKKPAAPHQRSTLESASSEGERKMKSPQDVGDIDTKPAPNRAKERAAALLIVDNDFSSDGDNGGGADDEEEEAGTPVKPRGKRNNRVIFESDGEDNDSDEGTSAVEDDVFMHELQGSNGSTAAADWMAAFGRGSKKQKATNNSDGWLSVAGIREQKQHKRDGASSSKKHSFSSSRKRDQFQERDAYEDDPEDDYYTRSHDEVGNLLHECEQIAGKLRRSIKKWSGKPTSSTSSTALPAGDNDGDDAEDHISLAAINTVDSRVVTQDDIPNISEKLILKPYQVVGVNWLLLLCQNNVSGVLADEMGLGKTVQTISFLLLLESMAKNKRAGVVGGPHLIVVPASVLSNWKREFAWIAPTLRVVIYHGAKEDRFILQDTLSTDDFDILLTTYTYFERDSCQEDRNFLRNFSFGYMILDEGHSIKNSKTSRFKRISAMRAKNRLVLSGTPIQNNLNELLALLSFLMPRMFDHGSDELLSFFDGNEQKKCAKVRKILAPFILRREKKYVLSQLVPKTVKVEMVKLGEVQQKVYTDLIESVIKQKENEAARKQEEKERKRKKRSKLDRQVQLLLGDETLAASKASSEISSDHAIFTQLRKAANHPVLLRNHYVSDEVLSTMTRCLHRAEAFGNQCTLAMVRKELESYSDFELHDLCVQYEANEELQKLQLPTETLLASVKFDYLRKLLPELHRDGHRVLIFSQWTKLLDLMEVLMNHMEYRYLRLDGSTDVTARQGLIDTFNQDKNLFVFLLSTRAGGLGINLTAADTVILHDLDFNPTNDEQACDRCHRIGQTKPVSIYKLVSENTVDHEIYKLGEMKTQLNNAVLGKLNAQYDDSIKKRKASDNVTVEMLLASVISSYKRSDMKAKP